MDHAQIQNPSRPAGGNAPRAPRLPYPAPPNVVVRLSPSERLGLEALCKLTGLFAGEVAAVLIEHRLMAKPASMPLSENAATLRRLYQERCRRLAAMVATTVGCAPVLASSDLPSGPPPDRVRIPLSVDMNRRLYCVAVDSGLGRGDLGRELLRVGIHESQKLVEELEKQAAQLKHQADPSASEQGRAATTTTGGTA
jgi:hypothetical protein